MYIGDLRFCLLDKEPSTHAIEKWKRKRPLFRLSRACSSSRLPLKLLRGRGIALHINTHVYIHVSLSVYTYMHTYMAASH